MNEFEGELLVGFNCAWKGECEPEEVATCIPLEVQLLLENAMKDLSKNNNKNRVVYVAICDIDKE
jgi:hypothetical protein